MCNTFKKYSLSVFKTDRLVGELFQFPTVICKLNGKKPITEAVCAAIFCRLSRREEGFPLQIKYFNNQYFVTSQSL